MGYYIPPESTSAGSKGYQDNDVASQESSSTKSTTVGGVYSTLLPSQTMYLYQANKWNNIYMLDDSAMKRESDKSRNSAHQIDSNEHNNLVKNKSGKPGTLIYKLYRWLERLTILKILGLISQLSVVVGVASYILTERQRHNAEVYQAWQVITAAYGQSGDGGRKKSLEFLNSTPGVEGRRRFPAFWLVWEGERLTGLEVPNAYLRGLRVPNSAIVEGDFRETYLLDAIFRGSDLRRADFRMATLEGTDFTGATVAGSDFRETDLEKANMHQAFYTDSSSSSEICSFFNAPHPCPTLFPDNYDPVKHGLVLTQSVDIEK